MAALVKVVHAAKTVGNVTKLFANLFTAPAATPAICAAICTRIPVHQAALLHTTSRRNNLMEFFDDKENWDKKYVRTGRSWRKDDLRIKSNEDLHKLWFVLLKERNMLLTMEKLYIDKSIAVVSPERLDKVEESMENLEEVVRERNRAYHMLETGEDGERPGKMVYSPIGLRYYYRMRQHAIPRFMNTKWRENNKFGFGGYAVQKFLRLYREKLARMELTYKKRCRRKVIEMLRTFPNVDIEVLQEKYPMVDVKKVMECSDAQRHGEPRSL